MNTFLNNGPVYAPITRSILLLATILACHCGSTSAQEQEEPTSAGARYATEVTKALKPLLEQYGPDAVNLQGNLMRYAIDSGALLETSIGISGVVERQDSTYLVLSIKTGRVFKDPDVPAAERPALIWIDIVEPSLRHCKRFQIPAEGLEIRASYQHGEFESREELARRLRDNAIFAKMVTFRFPSSHVIDLANQRISSQELLDRAQVEADGIDVGLRLPSQTPTSR